MQNNQQDSPANENGKQIVVAVDICAQDQSLLDRAALLAQHNRAELRALLIEDINLLHLAALPFTVEIHRGSGEARPIDLVSIARDLHQQRQKTLQQLEKIAKRRKIRTSSQTVRGYYDREALQAATTNDMTFLFRVSRKPATQPQNTYPAAALDAVYIAYDGSSGADRAVAKGLQLAKLLKQSSVILLLPGQENNLQALKHAAEELPGALNSTVHIVSSPHNSLQAVADIVRVGRGSALIVNRNNVMLDAQLADSEVLERLLDELSCPLGVVA